MDPLERTIIKLGGKIKRALETLEDNKKLCSLIRENVETIFDMLDPADNNTKIMCKSLGNLGKDMEKALSLISDCQEMSKKLKEANQTIIDSMEMTHFPMTSLQPAPSMVPILSLVLSTRIVIRATPFLFQRINKYESCLQSSMYFRICYWLRKKKFRFNEFIVGHLERNEADREE
jgi:hypothetical protein